MGDYVIHSVKKLRSSVRPSVRPSVCPSVCPSIRPSAPGFHSLPDASFNNFLQTWYKSWYWEGVSWDCRWVNFDKYVQSYGPWFTLEIDFRSLSLAFLYRFSSNFAWELISWGNLPICNPKTLLPNINSHAKFGHFFTDFLQTLHESWYWEGVSCDSRCVNFDKYVQSYGPWFML